MAISFSRPDPASPAAVGSAGFAQVRRGYDPGEVRDFLRMVAAELARLQERERFLESELRAMQTRGMSAPGRLDEETVTTLLGEEAARVLAAARDASAQIRDRAEESATRMVKEAAEDANRIRESATLDAQRIREEAAGDAEAEIELAKQQGRDMVVEAREYREKVLTELAKRRDAARMQIDKLLQDRERLMTAFGRAKASSEEALVSLADAHEDDEPFISKPTERPRVNPNHPSVTSGIYDRAMEDLTGDAPPARPVTGSIVTTPAMRESAGVEQGADTGGESDGAAGGVIAEQEETVVVDDSVETSFPVEIPDDERDASSSGGDIAVDEIDDTVTVVSDLEEISTGDPGSTTGTGDVGGTAGPSDGLATVVELFGGDRRSGSRASRDDAHLENIEIDDTQIDDAASTETDPPSEATRKVDDLFARLRAASVEAVSSAAAESVATATHQPEPEALRPAPAAVAVADPALFAARDAALGPMIESIARRLKRVLMDEQNRMLEHLGQRRSSLEPDAVLGDGEERRGSWMSAIAADVLAAATEGAKSMKPHGGSTKRMTSGAVEDTVLAALDRMVLGPVRIGLEEAIGSAGGDRTVISDAVRSMFRDWKTRTDAVAADVAHLAHSRGALLSLDDTTALCWMTHPDGDACADCADNSLAGSVRRGEAFPTGDVHPGAHPGCRCLLGPVQH